MRFIKGAIVFGLAIYLAQAATVTGTVTDSVTGLGMSGATVTLLKAALSATTSATGAFTLTTTTFPDTIQVKKPYNVLQRKLLADSAAGVGVTIKMRPNASDCPSVTSANEGVSNGDYYVTNNLIATSGVTQSLYMCSYPYWYVVANMAAGDGSIKSFPNIQMNLPSVPISSFTTLKCDYVETSPHASGMKYVACFDIWVNSTASASARDLGSQAIAPSMPVMSPQGEILLNLQEAARVTVKTYSVNGKQIGSMERKLGTGSHSIMPAKAHSGVYLYQVAVNGKTYTLQQANVEGRAYTKANTNAGTTPFQGLSKSAGTLNGTEIMIWNDNWYGPQANIGTKSVGDTARDTMGLPTPMNYFPYLVTNTATQKISMITFVPGAPYGSSYPKPQNILIFLKYAMAKGWIPTTSTLDRVSYGFKLISTNSISSMFVVSTFQLLVN
jgi:hypothetical protein